MSPLPDSGRVPSVVAILAAALVTGCGSVANAHSNGHNRTGIVTGVIKRDGPMCPQSGCGPAGGLVTMFNRSGRVVAHESVRAGKHFRFVLAPNRYELNAGTRLRYHYPYNCPPQAALVRPGRTTQVVVREDCGVI